MADLEAKDAQSEVEAFEERQFFKSEKAKTAFEKMFRRVVLFVSFGPGVLGVLWLIGRILRR